MPQARRTKTDCTKSAAACPMRNFVRASRRTSLAISFLVLASWDAMGQTTLTFTVLHTFPNGPDGQPANLIQDAAGNIYGTTLRGGDLNCFHEPNGCGTVFKLDAAGFLTTLAAFTGKHGTGEHPVGLIRDTEGNFYGVNQAGGAFGFGTVYRLSPEGKVTVFQSFLDHADGALPSGNLVGDAAGNLYGVAGDGGLGASCCGVVFKIDANRAYSELHTFTGSPDGSQPSGPLILDKAGNLYGTTNFGGSNNGGTVYKLDPAGVLTVLHSFDFGEEGGAPANGVIKDESGNLYGTTSGGGVANGKGTLFKLDPAGNFTLLHSFSGGMEGYAPSGPLLLSAATGNLYGTAGGGPNGLGLLFQFNPSTKRFSVLHLFSLATGFPSSDLVGRVTNDGNAYELLGTTTNTCDRCNKGTVYQLTIAP